jgi:hypothetical protein
MARGILPFTRGEGHSGLARRESFSPRERGEGARRADEGVSFAYAGVGGTTITGTGAWRITSSFPSLGAVFALRKIASASDFVA